MFRFVRLCAHGCRRGACVTGDVPGNTRISVNPPRSSNTCLAFKYTKLVKPKLLLQLTCHGDTTCSCANNEDGIVSIGIVIIAVDASNGLPNHTQYLREE